MSTLFDTSLVAPIAIGALVVWRLHARIRRMVGRQRLAPIRPWISVSLIPLILLLILLGSVPQPPAALGLVAGAAVGIGLGLYGIRLTRFEVTPAGLFYTPNAHLGIALSLLLVLRLGYRFMQLHFSGHAIDGSSMRLGGSPLTLALFGTLAAYYATYAAGLLRWRARVRAQA